MLAASVLVVALQSTIKQQALFGNFPMLLRWNFHRLMLGQSMHFYQDEFAGRIATKVMQTALAVRDTWLIVCELVVFIVIYFVTLLFVLGDFDPRLIVPFLAWLGLYLLSLRYFVPRLARVGKLQADARSLMTGRITDAYTNIATVKLFSHAKREAAYARGAMQEFLAHGARADAPRHRLRDRQPHPVDGPHRRFGRCDAVAVDDGRGRRRARSRPPPRWRCA